MMDDAARNRKLRHAVLVASIPACLVAMLLYRAPIRDFVTAVLTTKTEQIASRIDIVSTVKPERPFRNDVSKRFWVDVK